MKRLPFFKLNPVFVAGSQKMIVGTLRKCFKRLKINAPFELFLAFLRKLVIIISDRVIFCSNEEIRICSVYENWSLIDCNFTEWSIPFPGPASEHWAKNGWQNYSFKSNSQNIFARYLWLEEFSSNKTSTYTWKSIINFIYRVNYRLIDISEVQRRKKN